MPSSPSRERVALIVESIVRHLRENPTAADTIEGVREIWVDVAASREEVEAAVEALRASGVLRSRTLPDGSQLFSAEGER